MTEQSQLGASSDGSVMIDIGGDRGALVIMTPAEMLGVEIEITPVDPDAPLGWSHEHHPAHAEPSPEHSHEHEHGAQSHDHPHSHPHTHGSGEPAEHDHAHGSDQTAGHDHAPGGHSHVYIDEQGRAIRREHVAVRERRGPAGIRYAAIFPSLREGEYTLFDLQGKPAHTVEIVGGQVAQFDWV